MPWPKLKRFLRHSRGQRDHANLVDTYTPIVYKLFPVGTNVRQHDEFYAQHARIYPPISAEAGEVRLMHLQPGQFEDEIHVKLSIANLTHKPDYECVSYTWGAIQPDRYVFLESMAYWVTLNQFNALRRLRYADRARTLWMDMFCIEQNSILERSQQLPLMGQIFTTCRNTIIWLGEPDSSWADEGVPDSVFERMKQSDFSRRLHPVALTDASSSSAHTLPQPLSWPDSIVINDLAGFEEKALYDRIADAITLIRFWSPDPPLSHIPFYEAASDGSWQLSRRVLNGWVVLGKILSMRWW